MSSVISSRSRRSNASPFSIMDSIFAIAFGLGLRFVVDAVSHHDFKLTGTLVGLWEGVITLHFVKKMPTSFDPYVAYGVRMFVDFLVTESLSRLVLVVVWTGLGMVLADITPAIWDDVGLNRIWRRFRRDLYTMSRSIPKVAFFPKARVVRFSPSRPPSVLEPSIVTTAAAASRTLDPPSTLAAPAQTIRKRHVPGSFPGTISEASTDLGSVLGRRPTTTLDTSSVAPPGAAQYRYSVMPTRRGSDDGSTDLSSAFSQNDDLDDGNLSSSDSSTTETETIDPSALNPSEIPDEEHATTAQEEVAVETAAAVAEDDSVTPKQKFLPFPFPPTPSDSAVRFDLYVNPNQRDLEPDLPVPPHTAGLEQIPDLSDDWENIRPEEAIQSSDERAPTPPAKDDLPAAYRDKGKAPWNPQIEQPSASTSKNLAGEWGVWDPNARPAASISPIPPPATSFMTYPSEQFVPPTADLLSLANSDPSPPYDDDFYVDDVNYNDSHNGAGPSHESATGYASNNVYETPTTHTPDDNTAEEDARITILLGESLSLAEREAELRRMEEENKRKWDEEERQKEAEELKRKQEEEEKQKTEEAQRKEEERKRKEEEEERQKREEAQRKEEEEKIKAEEEKKKMEEEKRKAEEQEQERIRLAKEEEENKKREASVERRRQADEEKRLEEEAKEEKRLEEERQAEALKKQKEEDEKRMEDEKKQAEDERKRKEEQDAKEKKQIEDEKRAEDERKRAEDERKQAEDEMKHKEEEEAKEKKRLEDEQKQKIAEAAQKQIEEEKKGKGEEGEAHASATIASGLATEEEGRKENDAEQQQAAGGAEPENAQTLRQQEVPSASDAQGQNAENAQDDIAESVISEASAIPENAGDRLHNTILLRAQMVETERVVEDLKGQPGKEDELKRAEKTLRKMERKAKRRYEAVLPIHKKDDLDLDKLGPKEAEKTLEATLEALIEPESKALYLNINLAKKKPGDRQKPNVIKVLNNFQLMPYTTSETGNGKILYVGVSEGDYSQWVTKYRQDASKEVEDDDPDGLWGPY